MRNLRSKDVVFANHHDHDREMRDQHDEENQRSRCARIVGVQCAIP